MEEQASTHRRRDAAGLGGWGCLLLLVLGGLGGGATLAFLGIARILRGSEEELRSASDAWLLADSLEGAVVLCAAGALALLVGTVAGVILLKDLLDESQRRTRGPVR